MWEKWSFEKIIIMISLIKDQIKTLAFGTLPSTFGLSCNLNARKTK